jgi:hypothetical protein
MQRQAERGQVFKAVSNQHTAEITMLELGFKLVIQAFSPVLTPF